MLRYLIIIQTFFYVAVSTDAGAIPKLNSLAASKYVVFLDFDGHYVSNSIWNSGNPINCSASGMTDIQITEVFNRVAEDFRPFDLNITTDSTYYLAAALTKRIRIIITGTNSWYSGVAGISYTTSFSWGDDTPAFVFCNMLGPNSPKMVAEACSHECGHTLGLSHQSKYGPDCDSPLEEYNSGTGSGETGWAPIMGISYYKNFTNWNLGPTPYTCSSIQDNLNVIATQNGFDYRADDYTATLNTNTTYLGSGNFSRTGIISKNTDKDAFRFNMPQSGTIHLSIIPNNVAIDYIGADLDIKAELYNSAAVLIKSYDPVTTMRVAIDTVLNSGAYYLLVSGSGNANTNSYGSLGGYTITGTNTLLPIYSIQLNGTTVNNNTILNWKIIADEAIQQLSIESSLDGKNFSELVQPDVTANRYSYEPNSTATIYYRLKVVLVTGSVSYSNIIALTLADRQKKLFNVSTLTQHIITINATEAYKYVLLNINGAVVGAGNGKQGLNRIDIDEKSNGIYLLNIYTNDSRQTEKIVKIN